MARCRRCRRVDSVPFLTAAWQAASKPLHLVHVEEELLERTLFHGDEEELNPSSVFASLDELVVLKLY